MACHTEPSMETRLDIIFQLMQALWTYTDVNSLNLIMVKEQLGHLSLAQPLFSGFLVGLQ